MSKKKANGGRGKTEEKTECVVRAMVATLTAQMNDTRVMIIAIRQSCNVLYETISHHRRVGCAHITQLPPGRAP